MSSAVAKRVNAMCTVDGCGNITRSTNAAYCEMHYGQIRRNGYIGPKPRPRLLEHSHGYMKLAAPGHKLTTPAEHFRVYEHRAEFYERFGDGPFPCKCCGVELQWDAACICRDTGDKSDNRIDNLEIRCRSCASKKAYEASKKTLAKTHYRWIDWNGQRKTVTEWATAIGLKPATLLRRLNQGWSIERMMTTRTNGSRNSPRPSRQKLTDAQIKEIRAMIGHFSYTDIAEVFGIGATTVGRIARGDRTENVR